MEGASRPVIRWLAPCFLPSYVQDAMQKFLTATLAVIVLSAAFLAEAVAAYPPNDWQVRRRVFDRLHGRGD